MNQEEKQLFMKFAIPCADTLIERDEITQDVMDGLIKKIVDGDEILDEEIAIFKVANSHCRFLAKKNSKDEIDTETIEQYFLGMHDEVVDDRFKQMGDFDPETCRIFSGKVVSVNGLATVETINDESEYRKDFVPEIKAGDLVLVHRNFIVKKISKKLADEMARRKENYLKNRL